MKAWLVALFACMLTLAGCLGDEEAPVEEPDEPEPVVEDPNLVFNTTQEVHVTGVRPSPVGGSFAFVPDEQDNCFRLEGVRTFLNGTLTATWAALPGVDTLDIRIEGNDTVVMTGTTGTTIDLAGLSARPDGSFMIMALPSDPGAAADQAVELTVMAEYEGEGTPLVTPGWSCIRTSPLVLLVPFAPAMP